MYIYAIVVYCYTALCFFVSTIPGRVTFARTYGSDGTSKI